MSHLICPKCEQALTQTDNQWQCPDRHSYDTARQGYTNLLLVNQKKSKHPGDDADMVRARTFFLDAGYYQPVSDAVNAWSNPAGIKGVNRVMMVSMLFGETGGRAPLATSHWMFLLRRHAALIASREISNPMTPESESSR